MRVTVYQPSLAEASDAALNAPTKVGYYCGRRPLVSEANPDMWLKPGLDGMRPSLDDSTVMHERDLLVSEVRRAVEKLERFDRMAHIFNGSE